MMQNGTEIKSVMQVWHRFFRLIWIIESSIYKKNYKSLRFKDIWILLIKYDLFTACLRDIVTARRLRLMEDTFCACMDCIRWKTKGEDLGYLYEAH